LGWQDRGFVTVRPLFLMFVRLAAWMALVRSAASKDAELLVLRQEVTVCAAALMALAARSRCGG
jgi:hypothetical protein